ncbi:HAL/PAL/TAL family ammonia-lyase [Paracoccus aminophilus]|uniref:Histidine ammonia-lyase n=1 Tax=Paracoccus aminophilus JCM 7686 TaxID=1367847 RepID=S5XZZ7_PARAH|nr:histidine ammonia-lyase [Paracoccus aminophilus]AGT10867.1 histidine ammonia-lyase [Paracoccus aminophilus JCM 7686]
MNSHKVFLGKSPLRASDVSAIARDRAELVLDETAVARIRASRALVERFAAESRPVYGLNTGLGASVDTPLSAADMIDFQRRVTHSHSVALGPMLPTDAVRALMVSRISGMAAGGAGVSETVVRGLVAALNAGLHPQIPSWGSIGAADLAPLAHMAKALRGDGMAEIGGKVMPAASALLLAGLEPLDIREKDGHALVVANSLSTGTACLCAEDTKNALDWSLAAVALNYEAFRATTTALDADALAARPAFGQQEIGARLREELKGSGLWQPGAARRLQDPLSYRCVPQVWGALLHALNEATLATEIELTHSGDNPVILPDRDKIVSHGNFDMTAFVLSWERLGQALAHAAAATASRTMKLMSASVSDLPRFLSAKGQHQAGFAVVQKPIAALEAEIRHLANPISLSPMAVSDGIEDQSSMAPRVVAKTAEIVERFRYLVAIELMAAATAVELRGVVDQLGEGPRKSYEAIRILSAPLDEDREVSSDITRIAAVVSLPRP